MNVLRIFYFVEVGRLVMGGLCFLNFAIVDLKNNNSICGIELIIFLCMCVWFVF